MTTTCANCGVQGSEASMFKSRRSGKWFCSSPEECTGRQATNLIHAFILREHVATEAVSSFDTTLEALL